MQKQTDETNKIYEEMMKKDQEMIKLRRINQQNEDEREQLQTNVNLAMKGIWFSYFYNKSDYSLQQ